MKSKEIVDVCRLCPSEVKGQKLMNVFDKTISLKYDMKEVIFLTTGVEIKETDFISKKICQRCCKILINWFDFRRDAVKQDMYLKEKCAQLLESKGFYLPNSSVTVKKQKLHGDVIPLKDDLKPKIHPSVKDIYVNYPHIKTPSKSLDKHMTPIVALTMGEVENYFKKRSLDIRNYIYRPDADRKTIKKPKMVSPLIIRRKMIEEICNDPEPSPGSTKVICKPKKRKRSCSETNTSEICERVDENIQPDLTSTEQIPKHNAILPETSEITNEKISSSSAIEEVMTKNSEDRFSTNIPQCTKVSMMSTSETYGLTPTFETTKSHTLLVCNLCGSIHQNSADLKRHTKRHMICQFCKTKFKSVEAKESHVDKSCQIKEMMNSKGTVVLLEKIDHDLEVRQKYKKAFLEFEPIPGLVEAAPLERVLLIAASPQPTIAQQDIIVLSDEDDCILTDSSSDPLGATTTFPSISVVRPEIRIKNSTILNSLTENVTDKKLVKDLLILFEKESDSVEVMTQTDLPSTKDIKFNYKDGSWILKNIKGHMHTFMISINMCFGNSNVSYQFNPPDDPPIHMDLWNNENAIVIDVDKEISSNSRAAESLSSPSNIVSQPNNENAIVINVDREISSNTRAAEGLQSFSASHPQCSRPSMIVSASATVVPSSGFLSSSNIVSQKQCSRPSMSVSASASVVPSSGYVRPHESVTKQYNISAPENVSSISLNKSINMTNSATPLLQNYAMSMAQQPAFNNPIPIPRTYINSAYNNTASVSNKSLPSLNNNVRSTSTSSQPTVLTNNVSYQTLSPGMGTTASKMLKGTQQPCGLTNKTVNTNQMFGQNNNTVNSSNIIQSSSHISNQTLPARTIANITITSNVVLPPSTRGVSVNRPLSWGMIRTSPGSVPTSSVNNTMNINVPQQFYLLSNNFPSNNVSQTPRYQVQYQPSNRISNNHLNMPSMAVAQSSNLRPSFQPISTLPITVPPQSSSIVTTEPGFSGSTTNSTTDSVKFRVKDLRELQ